MTHGTDWGDIERTHIEETEAKKRPAKALTVKPQKRKARDDSERHAAGELPKDPFDGTVVMESRTAVLAAAIESSKAKAKDWNDILRETGTLPDPEDVSVLVQARRDSTAEFLAEVAEAQRTAQSEPDYVLESAADVAAPLPPLVWFCKGLRLARGSLTIVGGYSYSRKTLYAQDVALSVASGKDALGLYSVTRAPVLHIDYEQGHRITRERYQRMARARGIDLREAALSVVTFPKFRLNSGNARDVLRRLLDETRAGLVIVDSLRASVSGVEENSSEIREHIDLLGQEIKRVDAAGILLHHARKPAGDGKGGGRYSLRGSGAIFDSADGVFIFSGEKGESTVVDHEKDRLVGTELAPFGLDSEDIDHDDDPRWGLLLKHVEGEQLRQIDETKASETEARARTERIGKLEEYLATLPQKTWKGTRSNLAKMVGGKTAVTMAVLGDLISQGRLLEVVSGRETKAIRWA